MTHSSGKPSPQQAKEAFRSAVRAALPLSDGKALQFAVPFEEATQVFGDELLLDIDPGHLTENLPFQIRIAQTPTRICDFFHGAGNWKRISFDFRDRPIYQEMQEILTHDGPLRNLKSYRDCVAQMSEGRPRTSNGVALDRIEKIDLYFQSNRKLLDSIRAHGVMRRPAFDTVRAEAYETSPVRTLHSEVIERDVGIGIGANGEIYRVCQGLHRTAAAVLLGVPVMPVQLRLIHLGFLRRMMREDGSGIIAAVRRCIGFARERYGSAVPAPSAPASEAECPTIFRDRV